MAEGSPSVDGARPRRDDPPALVREFAEELAREARARASVGNAAAESPSWSWDAIWTEAQHAESTDQAVGSALVMVRNLLTAQDLKRCDPPRPLSPAPPPLDVAAP